MVFRRQYSKSGHISKQQSLYSTTGDSGVAGDNAVGESDLTGTGGLR